MAINAVGLQESDRYDANLQIVIALSLVLNIIFHFEDFKTCIACRLLHRITHL